MSYDIGEKYEWFIFGQNKDGTLVDIADTENDTILSHLPKELAEQICIAQNKSIAKTREEAKGLIFYYKGIKVSEKISFYHSQNINLIPDNSKEKLCTMVINNRTQACVIDFEESRLGEVVLINEKYVTLKEGSFNWSNL